MPFAFAASAVAADACLHCGSVLPAGAGAGRFCCAGCEAVHALLEAEGLGGYYALSGRTGAPAKPPSGERSRAWLEPLLAQAERQPGPLCALALDLQGLQCAACVWLLHELFRREPGGADILVNPALGTVRLRWQRARFDVGAFLSRVERFGYQFGPPRKRAAPASSGLPLRLGICAALTMNVMLFSVSFYAGLGPAEPEAFTLFTWLSAALSTVVVAVGGAPFFRAALQGLRRGVLHLDLPIALGILGVYATSLLSLLESGRGDLAYFDTLNTFVTLMLVGRWLQQRLIERNRRFLLEDDGAEGILAPRIAEGALESVPLPRLREGDLLLVAPGDLVPVESELLEAGAAVSTDWISGESIPEHIPEGGRVPAGAFNAERRALTVRALTDFASSPLLALLSAGSPSPSRQRSGSAPFWSRLARRWAGWVLTVASLGVVLWWPQGPSRALEVGVALLVVTCPCAIGIAVPLAYELVLSRLRRQGFFVRAPDLLDRLPQVRTVLFDKTGTLTLGRLELSDPHAVAALPEAARDMAYGLAGRSNHPVSRALALALERQGARFLAGLAVTEHPGRGLETCWQGAVWRLGTPGWAAPGAQVPEGATVLTRDGEPLAAFPLHEAVRPDAARELGALQAEGREVWLLSGDAPAKVGALARELGIPPSRALASQRPEEKAEVVARIDRADTLYLGDGVNDSLAFDRAFCAGTPAIDRPVMPGKSDFFLLGEGLGPLREALALSVQLRRVVKTVLRLSFVYNVLAVGVCLAGWMSPLRAAVAMPASSLLILLFVVLRLARPSAPAPAAAALPLRVVEGVA